MRGLVLFSLLTIAMPMAYGHGDADWARGHVGHVKVTKVEGYFIDDSATITVAGKTISGKFSIPMKVYNDGYTDYDDDLSYVWDNSSFPEPFYEDIGTNECYSEYSMSHALGPATFSFANQTMTLKDFPINLLSYHDHYGEEHKGLRIKIFYTYKEHGKEPVERITWTEC